VIKYILVDENTKNCFTVNYMLPSAFCTFCIACNPFYVHNIRGVFFAHVFRLLVVIIARDFNFNISDNRTEIMTSTLS